MTDPAQALTTFALRAVAPLADALEDPARLDRLLRDLGWRSNLSIEVLTALRGAMGLAEALEAAATAVEALSRAADPGLADVLAVVTAAGQVLDKVRGVAALAGKVPGAPFEAPGFWDDLGRDLPPLLLARELAVESPVVHAVLLLAGILEYRNVAAAPGRLPYRQAVLDWNGLGELIRDPSGQIAARYGWGGTLQHDRLLRTLEEALLALGLPVHRRPVAGPARRHFPGAPGDVAQLVIPLVEGAPADGSAYLRAALELTPVPGASATDNVPTGLSLLPALAGAATADLPLGGTLHLEIAGGAAVEGGLELLLYPGGASVHADVPDAHVDVAVRLADRVTARRALIGSPDSHRIEVGAVWISVRGIGDLVSGRADGEVQLELGTEPSGVAAVLQFAEADGFLGSIFGTEPQRLELGGSLTWSSKTGLRFSGNAGLLLTIPIEKQIGVVRLDTLVAGIEAGSDGARVLVAISGGLSIGPMAAVVDQVGVALALRPVAPGAPSGAAGDLDVAFAFKPPSGIGLSLDVGPVSGGGFVFFDPEREQYAGVLHLEFADTIAVTAIALLTTRMADGSKGFSLLVIVAASGFTPIQLGMGFTLSGIGGLLGINRSVDLDVLRPGLRSGALDGILFPEDPVRNAPAIVHSLASIFPATRNHFVLGPMAILGWGTPNLVTLKLGLLLEAPSPTRLLLLGRLSVLLPTPKKALVQIQLDALGVLDFDKGELSLDATLFDSRILSFALTGDMAMRVGWGAEPQFLLSVGGFNPRYPVPGNFPALRRLALELSDSDNPRLRLEAYLAVTSNTLQFGARAELFVSAAGFTLDGRLGFDVLLSFSPFGFIVDIYAALTVRLKGAVLFSVTADLTLSGPTPWRACGTASFTLLMLSVTVAFDVQLGGGDSPPPAIASTDVRALLADALADSRNWASELPAASPPLVALRDPGTAGTRVHPLAVLTVRQRVVPLHRHITTYGTSLPSGEQQFDLSVTADDGAWLVDPTPVMEPFALSQFDRLTDDQKLGLPAFADLPAGLSFGSDSLVLPETAVRERNVGYEATFYDPVMGRSGSADAAIASADAVTGLAPNRLATGVRP